MLVSIHLIFINDLDDGAEFALSKSVDDTKLEGEFDAPDGCAVIQSYLDRLGKWANRNVMKFSEGKGKVLHLGRNKPVHQYMLKPAHLESSFAEKDTWSWWTRSSVEANNTPLWQRRPIAS